MPSQAHARHCDFPTHPMSIPSTAIAHLTLLAPLPTHSSDLPIPSSDLPHLTLRALFPVPSNAYDHPRSCQVHSFATACQSPVHPTVLAPLPHPPLAIACPSIMPLHHHITPAAAAPAAAPHQQTSTRVFEQCSLHQPPCTKCVRSPEQSRCKCKMLTGDGTGC